MDQIKFTSLIVTYNSAHEISDLLGDLRMCAPSCPVIVVDNASQDQTVDGISEQFPEVRLIRNSQNLGYARAVNQGFDHCSTKYVFVLNPDIRIPGPQVIEAMLGCLEHSPQVGAVGPLQFTVEENGLGLRFNSSHWGSRAFGVYLSYQLHHNWSSAQPIRASLINAGCMLLRRSAFEQVGRFNPKYFLYGEEPDLCLKLRRYGYECWLLPNVHVIHYRQRSLHTVPARERLCIRWQSIWNISDAFLTGWWWIFLDNLTGNKPNANQVKSRSWLNM
jgi:GT2 family glycosyltransferase